LGADQPRKCRARVVAAANKDLQKLAGQSHGFRMDLYYRLSTHLIKVPHLRSRREDIPLLVKHLVEDAARSMNRETPLVSNEAMHLLLRHPFYGNIRELKTYLFDAVARCSGPEIPRELIAERLGGSAAAATKEFLEVNSLERLFGQFPTLEMLTNFAIEEALEMTSHNQSQAARLLGLSKQALHKRLKKQLPN
jgi:DNA-binding NtrC family response regulator